MKFSAILIALSIHAVFADYTVNFYNDAGTEGYVESSCAKRICRCFEGTQTAKIVNTNGGTVKAFSTTDCTGNYDTIAAGSSISNAQWVNSVSFGPSGTSYVQGTCNNLFTSQSFACP